jgi:hypothetical protein
MMNDEHKFWPPGLYGNDAMELAEGKIPHGHSSDVETIALPVEALPVRFQHDCSVCKSLGQFGDADLYFCEQGGSFPTVIARYSDDGADYQSGLSLTRIPELAEAKKRATEKGYLPVEDATPQIETLKPDEQKFFKYEVIQAFNSNGALFKVMNGTKQIGEDYLSKIVAENAADKLNMLRG